MRTLNTDATCLHQRYLQRNIATVFCELVQTPDLGKPRVTQLPVMTVKEICLQSHSGSDFDQYSTCNMTAIERYLVIVANRKIRKTARVKNSRRRSIANEHRHG